MQAQVVSLRAGPYKIIYDGRSDGYEMYDLGQDPDELVNLTSKEAPREDSRFTPLKGGLEGHLRRFAERYDEGRVPMDPNVRRALEALGYLR